MKILQVKTLKGGERLAEPVITMEQETLISKGTILKPEYLDLISFLGIDTVCIEDPYESYETPHHIMSRERTEAYTRRIRKILENHIYQKKQTLQNIIPLAGELIEEVKSVKDHTVIDMKERKGNLYEHTIMVTILSIMVAQKMKLKEASYYQLALGCLLHDLGLRYVTVPYMNYNIEEGTASEIFEFKKHTILAYTALEKEEWLEKSVRKLVLSHHERKDGSGFPLKQKTKETECNILQVCDAFDCAISGMECRRTSIQQAMGYLKKSSGTLFDSRIVNTLQSFVACYPVGTKVCLNTGEKGVVISQTKNPRYPVIGVLDQSDTMTKGRYHLLSDRKVSIIQTDSS